MFAILIQGRDSTWSQCRSRKEMQYENLEPHADQTVVYGVKHQLRPYSFFVALWGTVLTGHCSQGPTLLHSTPP